jgi:hypothetical protein
VSFDPWGRQRAILYCPPCETSHLAEVHIDRAGFPIREWLEPHVAEVQLRDRDADPLDDPVGAALEAALGEPDAPGGGRRGIPFSQGGSTVRKLPGERALSAPPFNEESGGRP